MRILLSFALLAAMLTGVVVFAYYFRKRLLVLFGINQPGHDLKDLERDARGKQASLPTEFGQKDMKLGGRPVARQATSSSSSSELTGGKGSDGNAPMIVVASDDANRGASLPYDVLAKSCGNWAESRKIGYGGAAAVYRGDLPRYGTVAVKRFWNKEGSSRQWTRELEALIQCRHPHILEIIGHADEGPENLIVMPVMEGGTLCEAMHKIWWATRVINMGQVVRALSFLHGKGILHRDVKSSNILLDGSLRHTRLADFGLAKDQVARAGQTCHGTTGVVMGSPGYMAPELMMRPATEKTDAFATGVVLLEILTGLPAWDTDENGAVLTDRAVVDGSLVDGLLDPAGRWPVAEVVDCSRQAITLTIFDPSQRKSLAALEQDGSYVQHLERALAADAERFGTSGLGSVN